MPWLIPDAHAQAVEAAREIVLRRLDRSAAPRAALAELLERKEVDSRVASEVLDRLVAVGQHLGEVMTGVHVQDGEGDRSGPEGLARQVQHDHGVLASGEQQDGVAAFGGDLPDDEDGLGLQDVKNAQGLGGHRGLGKVGETGRFEVRRLSRDRGRLGVGQGDAHRWIPHSVLVNPAQRPERGSSPGLTRAVHGAQPIEGYPSYRRGLMSTPCWSA